MPYGNDALKRLSTQECWEFLQRSTIGRVALCVAGEVDIFPLNYVADGTSILFRTAPGTKLLELTLNDRVALEADGYSENEAWSVVVKGTARQLETQSEIDAADATALAPWAPTLKYRYVRIAPTELTGRYFERTGEPDRY